MREADEETSALRNSRKPEHVGLGSLDGNLVIHGKRGKAGRCP